MKILEIDGGIASISHLILASLSVKSTNADLIPRFAQFDITDSDGDRLATLKTRMGNCGPRVSFNTLDLEAHSGLSDAETDYDLIVVCLVGFQSFSLSSTHIAMLISKRFRHFMVLLLSRSP